MSKTRTQRVSSDGIGASEGAVLNVTFDRRSAVPVYQQLKYHIHAISTGRVPPGGPLPSVRVVSRHLAMAPATVQRAYAELQSEGFVVGEAGRGVFVAELDVPRHVDETERRQSLRDIVMPPMRRAQALGFTAREVLSEVRELLSTDPAEETPSRGAPPISGQRAG
jgi:GntR family transcriptional regulator